MILHFDSLSNSDFTEYLRKANALHRLGHFRHLTPRELAKHIYDTEMKNKCE